MGRPSLSPSVCAFPRGFLRDLIEEENEKANKGALFSLHPQQNPPQPQDQWHPHCHKCQQLEN